MKPKFLLYSVFALTIFAFVAFSTSDNPVKTQSERNIGNNPEAVYGPSLNSPSSNLEESFEGTTFPPAGWVKLSPLGNVGFERATAGSVPTGWTGGANTTPPGGGNACAFVTYGLVGANNNEWLITPQITNVQPGDSLKFWLRYIFPTYSDSFLVKISTTTQTIAAMTIPVYAKFFNGAADTGYVQLKFNIGSLVPAGSNIYIGFNERITDNINNGSAFDLDLVQVTGTVTPPTCVYTWTTNTSGTTSNLYSVSTVNAQVGWAAGSAATVRRTVDGGATWTNANPTTPSVIQGDIYNIYAWSANDALVTTTPSAAATFIYKTANGGTTWTQVYTLAATNAFINAIQMISPTEGYAEGDPIGGKWTILKTTDGGNSWARMTTEPTQVGAEAGYNNSLQIVGTNIWFGTNTTKVYRSTDLGVTWSSAPTTGVAGTYDLHFNNNTSGLAGGTGTIMMKTTDGGASYTSAGNNPGASGAIVGITGGGTDYWAVRQGTDIYRTTNQGGTWTTAYTVPGAAFSHIDFEVVNGCPTGWAVTSTGGIAKMNSTAVGISNYSSEIPNSYLLKQNFPNPFNPTTNINFTIPQSGFVSLKIFDMVGKEVATLVNESKPAGNYIVGFNASNLPSGAYFYRIETNNFTDTKKMLLIK